MLDNAFTCFLPGALHFFLHFISLGTRNEAIASLYPLVYALYSVAEFLKFKSEFICFILSERSSGEEMLSVLTLPSNNKNNTLYY